MFKVESIPGFPDVKTIVTEYHSDYRGYFCEIFRNSIPDLPVFVQENISVSNKGVVRGLHYQLKPKAQAKLITCISGYIMDVFVDLRKKSPTYGKYGTVELFGPKTSLFVPEGFAHGFCALIDQTFVLYKVSDFYSSEHERSILYKDSDLHINWGLGYNDIYSASEKDKNAPLLKDVENNF